MFTTTKREDKPRVLFILGTFIFSESIRLRQSKS